MTTTRRFPRSARLAATAACLVALAGAAPAPKPFVPVLRENFPDAFIMQHGGLFYAYATNADRDAANLQMATSTDLVNWTLLRDPRNRRKLHDAMPTLAPWARKGFTWAPEVVAAGGKFVVYFTARESRSDLQCLGAAVSADPRGPFLSDAAEPLVCQRELGGTIDAHPFRDADGQLYLYYKNDGNNPKVLKTAQIWAQRLSPDGLKLVGEPGSLVAADKHWEWRVVEAPTMVRHAKAIRCSSRPIITVGGGPAPVQLRRRLRRLRRPHGSLRRCPRQPAALQPHGRVGLHQRPRTPVDLPGR
jgi:beta-xylosidase